MHVSSVIIPPKIHIRHPAITHIGVASALAFISVSISIGSISVFRASWLLRVVKVIRFTWVIMVMTPAKPSVNPADICTITPLESIVLRAIL
jgi:hypothetical protein